MLQLCMHDPLIPVQWELVVTTVPLNYMMFSFVFQLLKGRHVMVRVGGGWDTLQHYIATHDPCKIMEFKRNGSTSSDKKDDDKFLYIRGKYKS